MTIPISEPSPGRPATSSAPSLAAITRLSLPAPPLRSQRATTPSVRDHDTCCIPAAQRATMQPSEAPARNLTTTSLNGQQSHPPTADQFSSTCAPRAVTALQNGGDCWGCQGRVRCAATHLVVYFCLPPVRPSSVNGGHEAIRVALFLGLLRPRAGVTTLSLAPPA